MKTPHPPKTLTEFLQRLESQNRTVASWAREKNLPLGEVYALLRGRTLGRRGKAREIVLAMGLKPPPMFGAINANREPQRQRAAKAPA